MLEKEKRKAGKILVTESSDRNQFPAGMRVLALDANSVCLKYLVYLLEICRYRGSFFFHQIISFYFLF